MSERHQQSAARSGKGQGELLPPNGAPLYKNVEQMVSRRMADRELAPGAVVGTIADLAEELGVSIGTVKRGVQGLVRKGLVRLVRNRGIVVTAQREAIRASVEGYSRRRVFHTFLNAKYLPSEHVEIAQVLAGIEGGLSADGARLEILTLPPELEREGDFVLAQLARGSEGCFLFSLSDRKITQHVLDECDRVQLPLVLVDPLIADTFSLGSKTAILSDDLGARVETAARKLAEMGHRRVALAGWGNTLGSVFGACLDAITAYGFDADGELVCSWASFDSGTERVFAEHAANKVLSLTRRPTAVLVLESRTGRMTGAVIDALCARGVAVGKDISVVSTSVGVLATTQGDDAPAGTRTSPYAIGATSADVILGTAQGKREGGEIIRVAATWVDGSTLGPAPDVQAERKKGGPMRAQITDV